MTFRTIVIAAALVFAGSILWGNRKSWGPEATPVTVAKPIVFDNGTVRAPRTTVDVVGPPAPAGFAPGELRKCSKGKMVEYTNMTCPDGFRESAVTATNVTVVAATPVAKANDRGQGAKAKATLRDVLDINQPDNLRDKVMDRVIEGKP